jgi:hypothetical protein
MCYVFNACTIVLFNREEKANKENSPLFFFHFTFDHTFDKKRKKQNLTIKKNKNRIEQKLI